MTIPTTPMIAVIDVIIPKTIPMISPILSASPLPALQGCQHDEKRKDLLWIICMYIEYETSEPTDILAYASPPRLILM